jgi:hypothetical protein
MGFSRRQWSVVRGLEGAFGEEARRSGLGTCGSENGLIKD